MADDFYIDDSISIQVEGLDETCAMLDRAPEAIAKAGFARALAAACVPVVNALRWVCPIMADGSVHHDPPAGALKAKILTDIALYPDGKGGIAQIGFGSLGYVARLVEMGHRMIGHKPKKRELGTVRAQPFMRPATAVSAEDAVEAFAASLRETMQEGIPGVSTTGLSAAA